MKNTILLILVLFAVATKLKAQQPIPYLYQDSALVWKGFWITTETELPGPNGGTYMIYNGSLIPLTTQQVQSRLALINAENPDMPPLANGGQLPACNVAINYMQQVKCGPTTRLDQPNTTGSIYCVSCGNSDNTLCRGWYIDKNGVKNIIGGCGR